MTRDEVGRHLTAFAADFNAARSERMEDYYAPGFSAVVDGAFVARDSYLKSIADLIDAGYTDIAFDLKTVAALAGDTALADGTTTLRAPQGERLTSRFTVVCQRQGERVRFGYTHSSTAAGS